MTRLVLVLALVVLIGLAYWGLAVGWRHRAARQSDVAAPPAPPPGLDGELVAPLTGLYVSTTRSGRWQDRLVVHTLGRRARATVRLFDGGVLVDRVGEDPVWVPAAALDAVGTAPGIAGKVMGMDDGVLVLTWRLGDLPVDTGIRVDDLDAQQDWIAAAQRLLPGGARPTNGAGR
ncbi:PH-like domain-containing protein [Nakamurella endophytica]|uniref:Transporter n=1 Tax=Nakamurella endophytica TaxID=1748367 RepID=A0A917SKG1_9ACTN|nr:hypothetical protein [Nakamurella endophytica]GGL86254.1 transporter [Nakamurella endophytica]